MLRRRVLLLILLGVSLCALFAAGGGLWWLRHSGRAQRDGIAVVYDLRGPVTVRFDRWGVPHVEAQSARDLALALGWLHANERMLQLELGRHQAAGTLAEILGENLVAADRATRTLRLPGNAQRMLSALSAESLELLEAYALGVNAWLAGRGSDLPPELRLLRHRPEPWTPLDSLGFIALLQRELSYPAYAEELRLQWLAAVGPEVLSKLLGQSALEVGPGVAELATEWAQKRSAAASARPDASAEQDDAKHGSNAWALGAPRTASGHPIVASDPHLALGAPSLWYQALLRSPNYEAAGMTLPGVPLVVIGQGRELAWAFTNTELDTSDLFLERLSDNGTQVRRGEQWRTIDVENQLIPVRGEHSVAIELRSTDRGVLLEADPARGLPPRSLAWTAFEAFDPIAPIHALARAKSVEQIPAAIAGYVCPVQNLIAADRSGGMFYTVLGRVPERGRGDGRLPAPGWEPAYAWHGLRPQSQNPTLVSPPDELFVSANDDGRPPGYALPFAADFDMPFRARRIRELSLARDAWWPGDVVDAQVDTLSLYARMLVSLLPTDLAGEAAVARGDLAQWDGNMQLRGISALFALFEHELFEAAFGDELAYFGLRALPGHNRGEALLRLLRGELGETWFDDRRTPAVEDRIHVLERALSVAWRNGRARFGVEFAKWDYGSMHRWKPRHPLEDFPVFGSMFERPPVPLPGAATCVAAFSGRWRGGNIEVVHGPSMRWISDTDDPDRSLAVLPLGQSGHPFDALYDDQLPVFAAGKLHGVHWSEAAIAAATVSRLQLRP